MWSVQQKLDSFWHDYFLWSVLKVWQSYKGYCYGVILKSKWQFYFIGKSLQPYFVVGVICCLEDLVYASVRSPSRSSGHLSVAVQRCVQCCTAQYSAVQCGIFAGVSVLSASPLWQCSVLGRGHKREIIGRVNVKGNICIFDLVVMADKCDLGLVKKKAALTFVSWLWASQVSAQPGHSPPARLRLSNGLEKGNWKWLRKTLRKKTFL